METREDVGASGIAEIRGREELFDEILLAADEKKEERRIEQDQQTTMGRIIHEEGGNIRNRAVGGVEERSETKVVCPHTSSNSVIGSTSGRRHLESYQDGERKLLDENIQTLSEYDSKRLHVDEQRMNFQIEAENTTLQLKRNKDFNLLRLPLEEKLLKLSERRHMIMD